MTWWPQARPTRICRTIFWVSTTSLLMTLVLFWSTSRSTSTRQPNSVTSHLNFTAANDVVVRVPPPPQVIIDDVKRVELNPIAHVMSMSTPAAGRKHAPKLIEMTAEHKARLRHVADACQRMNVPTIPVKKMRAAAILDQMFVDDRHRYIYCRIGKVASTTWSRVLLVASGKLRNTKPNRFSQALTYSILNSGRALRALSSYKRKGIEWRLRNYFKFVFVRHPLDRMVSAFTDRLKSDHKLPKAIYTNRIISKYRWANESNREGLEFDEFVRYLVDPATKKSGFNPHWRPQYDRSLPCHIKYDFIGHYETLTEDADFILRRLGLDSRVTFPSQDRDNKKRMNVTTRLAAMFAKIPESDVKKLRTEVYGKDFDVFGYQ